MHGSIPPRTVEGALVCIRRGRREAWEMEDVLKRGTLGGGVADLLKLFSRARLIAGRTGSGKTGLLEALANSWPGDPHTLAIEDHTMAISIHSTPNSRSRPTCLSPRPRRILSRWRPISR